MSQSVSNLGPYGIYQYPAIIGMKADSMEDNVDTLACDADTIAFGVVVGFSEQGTQKIRTGGERPRGISVHDHLVGSRMSYHRYEPVSTLTRGRVWAKVSNATGVEDGAAVHYNETTGEVAASGGSALLNAVFRSGAISLPDAAQTAWGAGAMSLGAVVELHYPFAEPAEGNGG